MASKADRFYFENFIETADYACRAADYLVECLSDFDLSRIEEMLRRMHEIEHQGDIKRHEVSAALAKAFVTPVDREDLASISNNIDEVTDSIEEVLQQCYVWQVNAIPADAIQFARLIAKSCRLMKDMIAEFSNFKKPEKLRSLIVELSNVEEECDVFYLKASLNAKESCTDVMDIITWRRIYDRMENCADACEHVGDCVDTVVMKNT